MDKSHLESQYADGYSWDEYLLLVNRSANLHKKRYNEVLDTDLPDITANFPQKAFIITEEGCGDCAWAVPKIVRVLENISGITYKLFPRGEFPELQNMFLTNGKRAVPKLVLCNDTYDVLGEWGPRPAEIQAYVEKSIGVIERNVWFPKVLTFYRNEGQQILIEELKSLFEKIYNNTGE